MKNFLGSLLGALVALVIFSGALVTLGIGLLGALAALGESEKSSPAVLPGSYLVLDLSTNFSDAPPHLDLAALGGREESLQLRAATRSLRAAATDERITGVYLTGDLNPAGYGSGHAALRELRAALLAFREAGKPVVAYLTFASTRTYYVASAASDLALDPYGMILLPGLAAEPMFFAGAFEKVGINVQVTRAGKYKSAVEPFTRREMSAENREEVRELLQDLWDSLLGEIGTSRGVTAAQVQAVVDQEGLIRAAEALGAKLIDRTAYRDEIYDALKAKTGRAGSEKPFKQVTLAAYARQLKPASALPAPRRVEGVEPGSGKAGRIAIVYAEGEIVDGEGSPDEIGGARLSRELRKLRQDKNVRAVVLRVNSPGGSAASSEVVQREVRLLRREKPVVVSMGSYAASGGYWISAYADRIFAEPTTITGSIGVFGMQFDVQRLADSLGVTFDRVKTGRFADAMTVSRPKTPEEMAVLQRMVDWIYGEFLAKVAEGRNLPPDKVAAIAQGRVWSGADALAHGLVDELGGLDAALAYAAGKAGLAADYRVVEIPRERELVEAIQELIEKAVPGAARVTAGPLEELRRRLERELRALAACNDPQGVYARLPFTLSVR
ncbi:MAG: signal peptide peptidase SppA [Opitutia bacterium Tous-C8FEB]|jgi:protease-4|nr:MAG: signal peptide peptidase SppA [Opitutae bacterium Tous-C8FEB]